MKHITVVVFVVKIKRQAVKLGVFVIIGQQYFY